MANSHLVNSQQQRCGVLNCIFASYFLEVVRSDNVVTEWNAGKKGFCFLAAHEQICEVYWKAAGYPNSIRKDIRETNQRKTTEPLKWPDPHILTHGITPARSCI